MTAENLSTKSNATDSNRKFDIEHLMRQIHDSGTEYVDFRFTDLQGIWHHISFHKNGIDESVLEDGLAFDGSSIQGWRPIHNSDMIIVPDAHSVVADQIPEAPTMIVFCTVADPKTGKAYERDPRAVAIRGEEYIKKTGIGENAYFGPEPEFFLFDEIHFETNSQNSFYCINCSEGSYPNTGMSKHQPSNFRHHGHHPLPGKGYFPVPPVDSAQNLRADIVGTLNTMGLTSEKHHHEVAAGQHEIGFKYSSLLKTCDNLQLFKYVVRNKAHAAGKTATFMPKPIYGDNGSGMHVHQSIQDKNGTIFAGDEYAGLSKNALYYIGGILHHARSLCAFTNSTTNSYKRLVPGYEAPVYLNYSAHNRSAAIRIPHIASNTCKRIEVRFPDPLANGYLALTAMMMAGLDGIQNQIHPGEALDRNLYDAAKEDHNFGMLCTSLQDALRALNEDNEYLLKGGVFTKDLIEGYCDVKQQEINNLSRVPHPVEFEMYYSA